MKKIFFILILVTTNILLANLPKESIVKIHSSLSISNYAKPWQTPKRFQVSGSGVVIEDNYIITSAHVVANSKYIQVSKDKESKKYLEPWKINFNYGIDAVWGDAYTLPKYRNNKLNSISINNCLEYLRNKKIKRVFLSVKRSNKININSYKNFNTNLYCKSIKIKFLGKNFYFNYHIYNS